MTIVVQCPHCETKFNLQPEMIGKSMRCPNLDCRQVFPVKEQALPVEPPPPLPPDPEPEPLPEEPAEAPKPRRKPDKPQRAKAPLKPAIVDAQVVEAAVVAPPKVKEVVWSEDADAPPPPKNRKPETGKSAKPGKDKGKDRDFVPIRRRKKKRNLAPILIIGGVVLIVLIGGAAGFYLLRYQDMSEQQAADKADSEYKNHDYGAAEKSYEALAKDYAGGENEARYQFFARLCNMQVAVRGITVREDPEAAFHKLEEFVKAQDASPFAKPKTGFGLDVYEAGKKLGEDIVAHADDRIKAYRADRGNKSGELPRADKTIEMGRNLIRLIDRFRGDEMPPDEIARGLDKAEADVKHERDRSAAMARARDQLKAVTDPMIQVVEADLASAGFLEDVEAQAIIAEAKGKLRDMVRFEPDPLTPVQSAPPATASLLFVSPIGKTAEPSDSPPAIFLAVARGILYAIEERSGNMLWAVRIGQEVSDPPTVARVETDDGLLELALVTSNVNGEPSLAGYVLRTGQLLWYQKLTVTLPDGKTAPSPAAGPAVVVGTRAYVALRDPLGTIYEFDVPKGERRGRIRLGQPVGPGLVVRPGTGIIYAAADARRIFVIDAGLKDDNGDPRPPQCVQVIATGHPTGAIRTPPVLMGSPGDAPADRWMILAQSDGPGGMKVRAYTLLPIQTPSPDAQAPAETAAVPSAELPIKGWTWFPPATDGERLALVSDAGQFRLLEVRQPGSLDKALFPLPEQKLPAPPDGAPVRGVAFPAEEAAFWVLSNGVLQKFRLGLIPSRGLELLSIGPRVMLGEATQVPQFNVRKDAVCLVVRSPNSDGCKAVLLGLRDGRFRWQRQLGVVPASTPIGQGEGAVLIARDGGVITVPGESGAAGLGRAAPASWVVAPPPETATGPTAVAVSLDGKAVYTVTPVLATEEIKSIAKLLVRRIEGGKVVHEGTVSTPLLASGNPAPLMGSPVVLRGTLILPLATGLVYRHVPGTGRQNPDTLVAGPAWSNVPRTDASTKCHLTPLTGDSFLSTDGSRRILRWDWPTDGSYTQSGEWELRGQPAGPGLLLPGMGGGPQRLMLADLSGSIWLYSSDRGGKQIRRWAPGGGLPAGRPTTPLVMQTDASGRPTVAYAIEDRVVVCLDPDRDAPSWVLPVRPGDEVEGTIVGAPQPLGAGRWAVTDLGGRITVVETGTPWASSTIGLPGAVPATASVLLGTSSLLTALSDGSASVLPIPAPAAPAPELMPKE